MFLFSDFHDLLIVRQDGNFFRELELRRAGKRSIFLVGMVNADHGETAFTEQVDIGVDHVQRDFFFIG